MLEKAIHLIKGSSAEKAAASFLKKQGLRIIECNRRYKVGELDIIAEDNTEIIFVEVKYRSSNSHGTAAEMVTSKKQQRLQRAAMMWLQDNDPKTERPCRFDVITITNKNYTDIEWIQNAF